MSGEKRTPIQILQDEMRENRQQLYSIQRQRDQLRQELNRVCNENTGQITALKNQLEQRDKKQAAAVQSLKSDLREMATRHNRQLIEQRNLMIEEMQELEKRTSQQVGDLRAWAHNRLEEQRSEYKRITQEQQQQLNSLKRDIENINRREESREQRAQEYLSDLEILIKTAEETLPHERYTPGRLDKIKQKLAAARIQLQQDVPAATIATVQAAHFELMDLQEEIQRLETEYEITYRTVADAVGGLFASVRQNRQIQLEDDAAVQEANYWTQGAYQKLEDQVDAVKKHIEQNKQTLTTAQLNELLDDLEALTKEQEEVIKDAVERIISSQLRAEMGDVVIETLGHQGYRIMNNECGYAQHDQRASYMIKLSNVSGTEIVTVISPDEKTYQNVLSINTYKEEVYDDAAKRKRNADILNALRENGLQLGETQCYDQSIEAYYDVANLIKEGAKQLPKQVVQQAAALSTGASDAAQSNPAN